MFYWLFLWALLDVSTPCLRLRAALDRPGLWSSKPVLSAYRKLLRHSASRTLSCGIRFSFILINSFCHRFFLSSKSSMGLRIRGVPRTADESMLENSNLIVSPAFTCGLFSFAGSPGARFTLWVGASTSVRISFPFLVIVLSGLAICFAPAAFNHADHSIVSVRAPILSLPQPAPAKGAGEFLPPPESFLSSSFISFC